MTDWTEGYIADIGYLFEYFNELNPLKYRFAFLNQGIVLPEISTACELGFGQGISVNIHSIASNVEWWGTDFNPSQVEFAQSLAHGSNKKIHLGDEAFEDFCQRDDLPEFDFIAMHGIWTWISDKNRAVITDFVRRKLKVGGVFYISYNTQPGWAQLIPLRSILFEHTQVMGSSGEGVVSRVDAAIEFTERLFSSNPAYTRINPSVIERFNKIKKQHRNYLAHEYFNKDWQPMLISELAKWMETAKVRYVCSAHLLRNLDFIDLTIEQQSLLAEIDDPIFKETVRDYIINQQFRSDYWVKGGQMITQYERLELIRKQRVILTSYRPDITLMVNGFLGEASLIEEIYKPVLDVLADYKIKSVEQIEIILKPLGIDIGKIWQAIVVLAGKDVLAPTNEDALIDEIKPNTEKFNLHILNLAIHDQKVNCIASPVTGAGVRLSRFQQLFLLAYLQNYKQPVEWASFVWRILLTQNQRIIKDSTPLETTEENMDELIQQANDFALTQLPVLKGLGVLEIMD
jgi:SAM-dependent methyltransferase